MTRPRAADDFAAIRARMEELRREREHRRIDAEQQSESSPRPLHHRLASGDIKLQRGRPLPRSLVRKILD
jgi:hypothetical protein